MKLSKSQRAELKQKYGGKCAYCGCELGDKRHADHIEPVVRKSEWVKGVGCVQTGEQYFPENDNIQNMNPACQPCNNNKSTYSLESWRKSLNAYRTTIFRDSTAARHLDRFGDQPDHAQRDRFDRRSGQTAGDVGQHRPAFLEVDRHADQRV